jgi:hypothetical protein
MIDENAGIRAPEKAVLPLLKKNNQRLSLRVN